jgi:hypothetical protein
MKSTALFFAALLSLVSLTVSSAAENPDGIISKTELTPGSYCNVKFPAINEETLSSDNPVLKSRNSGDIIDFYGPCDEDPTGPDQVESQKQDLQRSLGRDYAD